MGIQSLLPFLRPLHKQIHLSQYAGKTLAIDTYCWIHRGAIACATELALGVETERYVEYVVDRLRLLKHFNIKVICVFDGGDLPAKKKTERERLLKRNINLELGKELLSKGNKTAAGEAFQKCIDVTPQMALKVIKKLRHMKIKYIVAPYEADAQLRYLDLKKQVDGIITEDSDLLAFGCQKVIYKLDKWGAGIEIDTSRLGEMTEFQDWRMDNFRQMCILSGCDYLSSVKGMGLKTAHKLMKKTKSWRMVVLEAARSANFVVSDYIKEFQRAEATFLYQRVFDPEQQCLVTLTPLPHPPEEWHAEDFYGSDILPLVAQEIAIGKRCPISHEPMIEWEAKISTIETPKEKSSAFSSGSTKRKITYIEKSTPSISHYFSGLVKKADTKKEPISVASLTPPESDVSHSSLNAIYGESFGEIANEWFDKSEQLPGTEQDQVIAEAMQKEEDSHIFAADNRISSEVATEETAVILETVTTQEPSPVNTKIAESAPRNCSQKVSESFEHKYGLLHSSIKKTATGSAAFHTSTKKTFHPIFPKEKPQIGTSQKSHDSLVSFGFTPREPLVDITPINTPTPEVISIQSSQSRMPSSDTVVKKERVHTPTSVIKVAAKGAKRVGLSRKQPLHRLSDSRTDTFQPPLKVFWQT